MSEGLSERGLLTPEWSRRSYLLVSYKLQFSAVRTMCSYYGAPHTDTLFHKPIIDHSLY